MHVPRSMPTPTLTRRFVVDLVLVLLYPIAVKATLVGCDLPWKNSRVLDYACGYSCALLISILLCIASSCFLPHNWPINKKMVVLLFVSGVTLGGAMFSSIRWPSDSRAGRFSIGLREGQFVIGFSTASMRASYRGTVGPSRGIRVSRSAAGFHGSRLSTSDKLGLVHARVMQSQGTQWFGLFIPLWVLLLGSWASILIVVCRWNEKLRKQGNLCRACTYDLTGNESGICPECGTELKCLER